MDDHTRRPDALEKGIRFGCGFLFGALIGVALAIRGLTEWTGVHWALIAGGAVVCALLALRFGDRYWDHVAAWLRWW